MVSFREIREHPNFQRIKDSVEFRSGGKDLLVVGILLALMTIVLLIPSRITGSTIIYWILYFFFIIPYFLYTAYRLLELFLHIDCYSFTEAVLDRPRQGYRGAMYFTVTLRDRSGREFEADTNHIFSKGTPNFEEHMNQKVLIGYNEETERVAVIKRLP